MQSDDDIPADRHPLTSSLGLGLSPKVGSPTRQVPLVIGYIEERLVSLRAGAPHHQEGHRLGPLVVDQRLLVRTRFLG